MLKVHYYCFIFVCLLACDSTTSNENILIGNYRIADQQIPVANLLVKKDNHLTLVSAAGENISTVAMNSDSFHIGDTFHFDPQPMTILQYTKRGKFGFWNVGDTIINYPVFLSTSYYSSLVSSQYVKLDELRERLEKHSWLYSPIPRVPNRHFDIDHILHFEDDQVFDVTRYAYQGSELYREYKKLSYSAFSVDNEVFVSFNPNGAKENPYPIFHVSAQDRASITWSRYDHRDIVEEVLTLVAKDPDIYKNDAGNQYENCFNGTVGEYYYGDFTYQEGNDYIVNLANQKLPSNSIDGYINFHFHINCDGKTGEFGLEQMDLKYQEREFDAVVVEHLFKVVRDLKDWPKIIGKKSHPEFKDVHAFLMFKFQNGKIVDLCP